MGSSSTRKVGRISGVSHSSVRQIIHRENGIFVPTNGSHCRSYILDRAIRNSSRHRMDRRDIIYTATGTRMLSIDRSSRKPSHHTACREPTASLTAVQTKATPSLRPLCLPEPSQGTWLKDIWYRGVPYVCCQWDPPINASIWSDVAHDGIGLQRNQTKSSSATNLDSIGAVMTFMFV
ncbi:hypothetical protein TNCV_2567941 [Trichonephila clavipes]|uniref:Uncharacterized protein n=1 Tax=Trichonephila clavipes TaxID=2585209 RepID=A0A8X6WKI3_TRICX|nr:hypothetical protein TNCV_2567941 [Trichonephila clavipes]